MKVRWRPAAQVDRDAILDYIAQDNPRAALELDEAFMDKARAAAQRPRLYRAERVRGTREVVVRPNYVMVYRIEGEGIEILRVLQRLLTRKFGALRCRPSGGTTFKVSATMGVLVQPRAHARRHDCICDHRAHQC